MVYSYYHEQLKLRMSFPFLAGGFLYFQKIFLLVAKRKSKIKKKLSPGRSRKSLTLESELVKILVNLKGKLILTTHEDWSVSTLVNLLALVGISSADKLPVRNWKAIKDMVEKKQIRVNRKTVQKCVSKLAN